MRKYWTIPKLWSGDCFIIGGGTSLKEFPFDRLKDKRVIGCNAAYTLGAIVCDFVCFGDYGWFLLHKEKLASYKSIIITNAPFSEKETRNTNVRVCRREDGYVRDKRDELGWFMNTGSTAIELAAKMGAKRIYLLGFDMKLTNGENNWYENIKDKPKKEVFPKFLRWFPRFKNQFEKLFPDVEVINANLDSGLDIYPKIDWKELL